jgi:hypothetical protein
VKEKSVADSRGLSLRRDHFVAASLVGAVVVVVGYASGLGLKPGMVAAASPPTVIADGKHPDAPATNQNQPPPSEPPPVDAVQPMPAMPNTGNPGMTPGWAPGMTMPAQAAPVLVGTPPVDQPPTNPSTPTNPTPRPATPPSPGTPPGPDTPLPACQPGLAQPLLDAVGGLPLLGSVTTGFGVTGPGGVLATILGYCQTPSGAGEPVLAASSTDPHSGG